MPVTLEKARVNVFNLIGFAICISSIAFTGGVLWTKMQANDDQAVRAIGELGDDIASIQKQLPAIIQLQWQMSEATRLIGENKERNQATNDRVDRIVESFGGKLDGVIDGINKLTTRVEVIATQIKNGNTERTRFPTGRLRP